MILVLDNEVKADYRFLASEIAKIVPDSEYRVFVDDPILPELDEFEGVILSGSTASVYEESQSDWVKKEIELVDMCIERGIPLLGVCFGHQLIHYALGGRVEHDRRRSTFVKLLDYDRDDPVLQGVKPVFPALHADRVVKPGKSMHSIGSTEYDEFFCTKHDSAMVWTTQGHPEYNERIRDKGSGWDEGNYSFEDCNSSKLLLNFASLCRQ
jgi:GMP synthase (glutamine-hydrolysing)